MYFEIYPTPPANVFGQANPFAPRQWRWRLRAANHQIVAHGESYVNRRDCEHVVQLLKSTTNYTAVRAVAQ